MDLRWIIAPIFHLTYFSVLTTIGTTQGLFTNDILQNDLKHFDRNRHHVTNPGGKRLARDYIRNRFISMGLHTWKENFTPNSRTPSVTGTNIVGVLPGKQYKTVYDRVILVGAHYDTVRSTRGVNDNGSGVVAMLQVARILTKKSSTCARVYSVMFVAFDFEEWEKSTIPGWACAQLGCGSRAFVSNISQYYNLFPNMSIARYGQLQCAIIMDTMMNYNSSPNSQIVPPQLKEAFPKQYNNIIGNAKRGDFLLVAGRYTDDMQLINIFKYYYNKNDQGRSDKYKLQVFPLPFDGPPSRLFPNKRKDLSPFLRSDHISFWDEITSNRALLLTDTGDLRGYMRTCYHKNCDDLGHVRNDFLGFLSKSCDTIVMTTEYLTITKCKSGRYSKNEGLTAAEGGVIGIATTMFAAVNALVAWIYCRRRTQDDQNVLVENDQMEEAKTDATSQSEAPRDLEFEA